ncbi:symporter small accessory protein [Gemmatimonadota bacterium]
MFGIADPWIAMAYLLCILSSILCIVYGLMKWNSDGESIEEEKAKRAKEEDKISEAL